MSAEIGRSFGIVDQAVKSITTVQEYLNVGTEITNEVAMDFVENSDKGSIKETHLFKYTENFTAKKTLKIFR